jgi:GAF domain-containing protein
MFYLTANNGPQKGRRYELKGETWILGRHPDCQIQIEVGAVSRNHCQIVREVDQFFVEDLGSRNGVIINGEPGKIRGRRQLRVGDVLRICEVSFTFASETSPTDTPVNHVDGRRLAFVADDADRSNAESDLGGVLVSVQVSSDVKRAAMAEIVRGMDQTRNLDELLPEVLKSLFKVFAQADRGFVVLETPDYKLIPRWVRVRREDAVETLRISRTIIRHVMRSKEAVLSADAASDERFEMSQAIADFRIRSMMCAPLLDKGGNAFGALQIDTLDQRNRFTTHDLEILKELAMPIGIAITTAQREQGHSDGLAAMDPNDSSVSKDRSSPTAETPAASYQSESLSRLVNTCRDLGSLDDVFRVASESLLTGLPNAHRCIILLRDEPYPREVRIHWDTQDLHKECGRLNELLRSRHVHCPMALLSGLQSEIADAKSEARRLLGADFERVVVLDCRKGIDEAGGFSANQYYRYVIGELAQCFGLSHDPAQYHPEEIAQILRDEKKSLICVLNVHVIPTDELSRLRGLTQEHHLTLFCGPIDFGVQHRRNQIVDDAGREFQWSVVESIADLVMRNGETVKLLGEPADSALLASLPANASEVESMIAAPISTRDAGCIGVVYIDARSPSGNSRFSASDVSFVQNVAAAISLCAAGRIVQ